MDTLRRFVDEEEMVRRIIYIATLESFHSAKSAYRMFKARARKMLLPIHVGPETLDEACADHIVRNLDLYDIEVSVREVVKQLNGNPIVSYPAECDFTLLNCYIRECSRIGLYYTLFLHIIITQFLAFEMQAVNPRIDIAHAIDGELFNEKKYVFKKTICQKYTTRRRMENIKFCIKGIAAATTRNTRHHLLHITSGLH